MSMMQYLALGDSYTIGEQVPSEQNFPNQVCSMLRKEGYGIDPPRIIASTGWTTDELEAGILAAEAEAPLSRENDLVTLLIGVNNQYRGRDVNEYALEFEELLKKALVYAGNKNEKVIVLSIPDWGVTPFARERDREQIALEIDAYNSVNRGIAQRYHIYYIDVTPWTREAAADPSLLAADGLHPSGREYRRWAERIVEFVRAGFRG